MNNDINGNSNLVQSVTCPYCGKPLIVRHSRNDMKLFAECSNDGCPRIVYYDIQSQELENLFYRQYYKEHNNLHIDE